MTKEEIKEHIKALNVLFVDDEEFVVEILKDILPLMFYQAHFASNGMEGLKIFEKEKIDLVITDLNMPKMNGITMLKNMKLLKNDIKSICVSGHNEKEFIEEAKKLGSSFIIKPINSNELFNALREIL